MIVKIKMPRVEEIIKKKGLGKDGAVQAFITNTVNRRIGRYMPHLTGALETKQKRITGPDEITVFGPQAKPLYYGKVMVNAETGKGPAKIPGVGYRFPRGSTLKASDRDMNYTKTFNPQAGPFWDRRMMAAEGEAIEAEIQKYVEGGSK